MQNIKNYFLVVLVGWWWVLSEKYFFTMHGLKIEGRKGTDRHFPYNRRNNKHYRLEPC